MHTNSIQSQDNTITGHESDIECARMDEERERMALLVSEGHNVDPPIKWFKEMCLQVDRDHPNITIYQRKMMVLGMWDDMTKSTKIEIIQRYERGNLN